MRRRGRPALRDAAALSDELLATGLTVDEVATRLRVGPTWRRKTRCLRARSFTEA